MSRRRDKQRREARRGREPRRDLHPPHAAMDPAAVRAKWLHLISTWRCRGSKEPLFAKLDLVFAPAVAVDLQGVEPPSAAMEGTIAAIVEQTVKQRPS